MVTLAPRAMLIATMAAITHTTLETTVGGAINDVVQYPLVFAIAPVLAGRLPIMGTSKLLENPRGSNQFMSALILIGASLASYLLTNHIKQSSQNDQLTTFLKGGPISIGPFKLKREFVVVLAISLLVDTAAQVLSQQLSSKNEHKRLVSAVVNGLNKYFESHKPK